MISEDFVQLAMEEAEIAVYEGNAPFGVVVTDFHGKIVWRDHDRVKEHYDPTAHGEINAVRALCSKFGQLKLKDTIFYTTSEPCPTCLSALIKARVPKVVYGAKTESTASLPIAAEELAQYANKHVIEIVGGVLSEECLKQRERLS